MKRVNSYRIECLNLIFLVIIVGVFLLPKYALASEVTPENIIRLTNLERESMETPPLTANQLLEKAAREKASAIFENQSFAHQIGKKNFSAWIRDAGYNYVFAGENLAVNFESSEEITDAWINSPLHKKNLLNRDFMEIGVAVIRGLWQGKETTLVVQIFGTPILSPVKLAPIAFDESFKNYPAPSGIESEKLLTHSASRILREYGSPAASGKIVLRGYDASPLASLFLKSQYDPSEMRLKILLVQACIFFLLAVLYFKLYNSPHCKI